jgi:pyruvate,orthophosphate dikinase
MGLKAYDLARMARLGMPVPPAFVLGTHHCLRSSSEQERYRKNLTSLLEEQMRWLQSVTGLGFGDPRKPLLVSARSGAPVSMPGMMDTILDIGLCDATARGLLRTTGNPRLVWDSYRRLIQGLAEIVFEVSPQPFSSAAEALLVREQVDRIQELDYLSLAELTQAYLQLFQDLTAKPFPQNPYEQLELAVQAVFASWNSPRAVDYRRLTGVPDDLCTAVTVQQMVFGNGGGMSGAGVGFTRDPDNGEKRLYFDFLFNSQGEDVVSGRSTSSDTERLFLGLPEIEQELHRIATALEEEFGDAQEFEFTIQEGVFYLLQTRTAKRTPWAALRMAVELVAEGIMDKTEALARLEGLSPDNILRQRLPSEGKELLCQGQPAGIGVATGPLAFDAEAARRFAGEGRPAVLIREEMATADIAAIALSAGVLTVRGNRTSHAAVVARQLGKACITGCTPLQLDSTRGVASFGDRFLAEGEMITIDANTGKVFAGLVEVVSEQPTEWLAEIAAWKSEI